MTERAVVLSEEGASKAPAATSDARGAIVMQSAELSFLRKWPGWQAQTGWPRLGSASAKAGASTITLQHLPPRSAVRHEMS